ncbi:hypothetical protein O9G_004263 [Rozella allomycis CSF55]|uniref:G domain-containing protein n=1 Tax=Rozella allomycis (strain CSF55) TaxID=988480 RepID=A0A075B2V7_ROZAC|nr:hypothetical protein O9G_004263 [Rozella allomycis CSF55]|eukprot:EPZ36904.1 hypothetical protein O9G_004263 [Rozella allomycis CSF55]
MLNTLRAPSENRLFFKGDKVSQPIVPFSQDVIVVGMPNSGKSTLFNSLIQSLASPTSIYPGTTNIVITGCVSQDNHQLASPTSIYPGTTNMVISGCVSQDYHQLVLKDTPSCLKVLKDIDFDELDRILYISNVDDKRIEEKELELMEFVYAQKLPITLVFSRSDDLTNASLLDAKKQMYQNIFRQRMDEIHFLVSGYKGFNIANLRNFLFSKCLKREWKYNATDKLIMSDVEKLNLIVREKVLRSIPTFLDQNFDQVTVEAYNDS